MATLFWWASGILHTDQVHLVGWETGSMRIYHFYESSLRTWTWPIGITWYILSNGTCRSRVIRPFKVQCIPWLLQVHISQLHLTLPNSYHGVAFSRLVPSERPYVSRSVLDMTIRQTLTQEWELDTRATHLSFSYLDALPLVGAGTCGAPSNWDGR